MAITKKAGTVMQLYRNTGSWGTPTWVAQKVKDLKFSDKPAGMFDTSDRTTSVNTKVPTRFEWSISFDFIHDSGDAGLMALVTAAQLGTGIDMAVTDDAIATSGTRGYHAEWCVESGWEPDGKLTDGLMVSMTLVPYGLYTNAPVRFTI